MMCKKSADRISLLGKGAMMDNPISNEVRKNITLKLSADFAAAVHDITGWPLVGLTANGRDWVYLAVLTPEGLILDVNDFSQNGDHIIDDDSIYEMVPNKDFVNNGDVWFIPVSYTEATEYIETDKVDFPEETMRDIAKKIVDWYNY